MEGDIYSIACDPSCNFAVQSHDKNEVVDLCWEHVSHAHPEKQVTREELTSMITPASFCSSKSY